MSSQIILDLREIPSNLTITPEEYFLLKKAIMATTVHFGEVCLVIGFVMGAVSVYLYYRDKISELQKKVEELKEEQDGSV
jgi:hypothetical protein